MRRSPFTLLTALVMFASSSLAGQATIQSGPEITDTNGTDVVITVELSVAAPAEIQYWTDASAAIQTIQHPSQKNHSFPIPGTPTRYYRVVVRDGAGTETLRTQTFSTKAANLPSGAVTLRDATVINGNILNVPVDATRPGQVAITWVKAQSTSNPKPQGADTRAFSAGHTDVQFVLPPPPHGNEIVNVAITATSGTQSDSKPSTPYAVSQPTSDFTVGGATATPSLNGVTIRAPITSPVLQTIDWSVTLHDGPFTRNETGFCPISSCVIQIDGLRPSTRFSYELAFNSGGVTKPSTSAAQQAFTTLSPPALVNGAKLEFTSTGFNVVANTTENATVELEYLDTNGNKITSRRTAPNKVHTIPVTQGLVFDAAGSGETTLEVVVRTPDAAATETARYPVSFKIARAPVTTPAAAQQLGGVRIRDMVNAVGPAALAFLGVPAPLVNALRSH